MVCLKTKKRTSDKDLDKPHLNLLEIISNCDWENSKTQILSKISHLISREVYPSSQKIAIKEFVVEILPKADKPAVIPPELQRALPTGMFSIRVKVIRAETDIPVDGNCDKNLASVLTTPPDENCLLSKGSVTNNDKEKVDTSLSFSTKLDRSQGTLLTVISTQNSDSVSKTSNGQASRTLSPTSDVADVTRDSSVVSSDTFGISGLSRLQINRPVGRCTMGSVSKSTPLGNVYLDNLKGVKRSMENGTDPSSHSKVKVTFNMTDNLTGSALRLKPGVDVNNTPDGLVISGPMVTKIKHGDEKIKKLLSEMETEKLSGSTNSSTCILSMAGTAPCSTASTSLAMNATDLAQSVPTTQDQKVLNLSSHNSSDVSQTILKLLNSTVDKLSVEENDAVIQNSFQCEMDSSHSIVSSGNSENGGIKTEHQTMSPTPFPAVNTLSGQATCGSENVPVPVTLIGPFSKPVRLLSTQAGSGVRTSSVIHFVPVDSESRMNGAPMHVTQPTAVGGKSSPKYIAVPVTLKPTKITKNKDLSEMNNGEKMEEYEAVDACSLQPTLTNGSFQTLVYADPITNKLIPLKSTGDSSSNIGEDLVTMEDKKNMSNSVLVCESKEHTVENFDQKLNGDPYVYEQKKTQTPENDIQSNDAGLTNSTSPKNICHSSDDGILESKSNDDMASNKVIEENDLTDSCLLNLECESVPTLWTDHDEVKSDVATTIVGAVNAWRENENTSPKTVERNCESDKGILANPFSNCGNPETTQANREGRKVTMVTEHIHNSSSNSADSDTTMIYIESDSELDSHEFGENSNRKVILIRKSDILKSGSGELTVDPCPNIQNCEKLGTKNFCDLKNGDILDKSSDTCSDLTLPNNADEIRCNSSDTGKFYSKIDPKRSSCEKDIDFESTDASLSFVNNSNNSLIKDVIAVEVQGEKKTGLCGRTVENKVAVVENSVCLDNIKTCADQKKENGAVNMVRNVDILNREPSAPCSVSGSRKRKTALVPRPDFEEPKKILKTKDDSHSVAKIVKGEQTSNISSGEIQKITPIVGDDNLVDVLEVSGVCYSRVYYRFFKIDISI